MAWLALGAIAGYFFLKQSAKAENSMTQIIKTTTSVYQSIAQDAILTNYQNIDITISNVGGDVDIRGNQFNVQATASMQSVFKGSDDATITNKLQQALTQTAQAVTSGFPVGNSSDSENFGKQIVSAASNIVSAIRQECLSSSTQNIRLLVNYVGGSVSLRDNTFDLLNSSIMSCVGDAINNSAVTNDISQKAQQFAKAVAEGPDLFTFLLIAIILFVLIIGGGIVIPMVVGFNTLVKLLGVILLVVGLILIAWYFFWVKTVETVYMYTYSDPASLNCGKTLGAPIVGVYKGATLDVANAGQALLDNKDAQGGLFDSDNNILQMYNQLDTKGEDVCFATTQPVDCGALGLDTDHCDQYRALYKVQGKSPWLLVVGSILSLGAIAVFVTGAAKAK